MALVRTDYGLIYNTDGSLCVTLLPEGGVAVTEGTTNLVTDQSFWNRRTGAIVTRELVTSGQWAGWYRVHVTRTGTGARGFIANVQLISVAVDSTHTWSIDFYSETGKVKPCLDGTFGIEDLSRVDEQRWALTWTNDRGLGGNQGIYFHHSDGAEIDVDEVFYYRWYQVEEKSYPTPFVEGTRPAGRLSYDIPQLKGARDFTLHFKFLPYMFKETDWQQYLFSTRTDNYLHYYASIGNSGTRLAINTALEEDDTWVYANIYNPPININSWHRFVMTGRQEGDQATLSIYLDGIEVYTSTRVGTLRPFPGILALGTNHSLSYAFNGAFRELYICPYAVSPETVATWHSLDAPFYDPREQIDAGARPIYAPGVQIDSTGAWGISGGVKQAGFGTDGKWVAGGGAIIADAQGLRSSDDSFIIKSNGEAEFKGKITAPIIDTPQIVGGAISQRIVSSFQSSTGNMNSTDSWVSLPTSLSFSLSETSEVLVTFSASTVLKAQDYRDYGILGVFRLVLNGVPIYASERYVGLSEYPVPGAGGTREFRSGLNITSALHLEPGWYQIQPQFRLSYSRPIIDGSAVFCLDRELSALILKR